MRIIDILAHICAWLGTVTLFLYILVSIDAHRYSITYVEIPLLFSAFVPSSPPPPPFVPEEYKEVRHLNERPNPEDCVSETWRFPTSRYLDGFDYEDREYTCKYKVKTKCVCIPSLGYYKLDPSAFQVWAEKIGTKDEEDS